MPTLSTDYSCYWNWWQEKSLDKAAIIPNKAMCLCGVVLWGIFCRLKQCWNLFNLFVKERETWMVQNSPLLGRYLWQLCQGFLRITFLSAVSRNGMTRKAPLCFSSFCSHCLYHNSFNMLSITNWRRVCGRCGKKKIFLEDSNNTVPAVCRHLFDLTLLPTFKIFINNIIWIFLSTGTDNISKWKYEVSRSFEE